MTLRVPTYNGPLGSFADETLDISQSHDEFSNVMRFRVKTRAFSRYVHITDEQYMEDYPAMELVDRLVRETALHVLLDAREKINEAIANLMG